MRSSTKSTAVSAQRVRAHLYLHNCQLDFPNSDLYAHGCQVSCQLCDFKTLILTFYQMPIWSDIKYLASQIFFVFTFPKARLKFMEVWRANKGFCL